MLQGITETTLPAIKQARTYYSLMCKVTVSWEGLEETSMMTNSTL